MSRFILRVWLPDRPGALGLVATRVGAVRGEIVGIEILERGGGRAIDELVVELPDKSLLDLLVREVTAVDGVDVEDLRRAPESVGDPGLAALETAAELLAAASPRDLLEVLVGQASTDFRCEWAAIIDADTSTVYAGTGDPPPPSWLKAFVEGSRSSPAAPEPESPSQEVTWAVLSSARLTLVLGRAGGPFRARERRRLKVLARIADTRWHEVSRRSADEVGRAGSA